MAGVDVRECCSVAGSTPVVTHGRATRAGQGREPDVEHVVQVGFDLAGACLP